MMLYYLLLQGIYQIGSKLKEGRIQLIIYIQMSTRIKKRNLSQLYRPPPPEDYSQNYCRLFIVIVIATIFIALEVIGGILSGSIAIISDAFHLVSDVLGFVFAFLFLYLSKKEMDKKVTFGYHRMELVGAILNIFIIWAMVLFIIYEATLRIIDRQFVKQPLIMLITAGGGLLINILLYKILHAGSSHSHGLLNDHDCQQHDHQHHQHKHQSHHQRHIHQKVEKQGNLIKEQKNSQFLSNDRRLKTVLQNAQQVDLLRAPLLKQDHVIDHFSQCQAPQPELNNHICQGNHTHQKYSGLKNKKPSQKHENCQGHSHKKQSQQKQQIEQDKLSQNSIEEHDRQIKHESIGMKSAIIHALSDLVQSVGILLAAIVIFFFGSDNGAKVTQWNAYHLFDPISTYIFSILSLLATLPVIHNCYYLLMESAPGHIDLDDLKEQFLKIKGIIDVHDIHIWDLKPGKTIIMAHVLAKEGSEREVLMKLTDLCRRQKIYHSTFQVQEQVQNNKDDYIRCHHDIH